MAQTATAAKAATSRKNNLLPSVIEKNKKLFLTYLGFLLVYAVFTLVPTPSKLTLLRYHLSSMGLRFIYVTIILFVAIIWWTGFYGYSKLRAYAKLIQKQKDGQKVEMMSRGILLLVMWLPISEVVSAVLNDEAAHHPGLLSVSTILDNYINLLLPLAAFIYIGLAARGLSAMIKYHYSYLWSSLIALVIVYVGIVYAHMVASTPNRPQVYHLSLWLVLLTIVVPYVYMWFIGAIAAYELYNYQKLVSGVLYRRSWKFLAAGCGWLIITSMVFQYVTTLAARLDKLSIYWILAIVYSLLALLSVGFIFIAIGTKRLNKIEQV